MNRFAYVLMVVLVTAVAGIGVNMYHTNRVAEDSDRRWQQLHEESNRKWCGVLRVYHDAYARNPAPPTQLGRDIQAQLEALYADFHCDKVKGL